MPIWLIIVLSSILLGIGSLVILFIFAAARLSYEYTLSTESEEKEKLYK